MKVVNLFLLDGGQADATDDEGKSAITHAVEEGASEVVEFLLDKAGIPNNQQQLLSLLTIAVLNDDVQTTRVLLDRGAPVGKICSPTGENVIQFAIRTRASPVLLNALCEKARGGGNL